MSNADTGILCLDGDCGLRKSAELVAEIANKLATQDAVVVDATGITAADISTVQILVSAHKSALAAGKALHVHAPLDGALGEVLVKGGFVAANGVALTPGDAPWVSDSPANSGDAA
jgi:ABC-type transporter Mla MlaB component